MRNAILADERRPTATTARPVDVFAARGMGYFASTDGSTDIAPVADFTDPAALSGSAAP